MVFGAIVVRERCGRRRSDRRTARKRDDCWLLRRESAALVSGFVLLARIAYALCYMTGNLGRGLSLKKQKIGPN